ncbi:MAG TPA: FAD:protein FMN transferase, partial [Clostridia bacterium]|nr:FAD:protein FMN transferase [Clostridia bacterium]
DKQDEDNPYIDIVYMQDMSLVTSGTYERFYTVNETNYHHIIDPQTLYPADYFLSVSVLCKDSGLADVLSTALFLMPYEEGVEFVNGLPETEALWVMKNGEVRYSEGFEEHIKR